MSSTTKPIIKKKIASKVELSKVELSKTEKEQDKDISIDADDIETIKETPKPVAKIIKKKMVNIQSIDKVDKVDNMDKVDTVELDDESVPKDSTDKQNTKEVDEILVDVSKAVKTSSISKKTVNKKQEVQNIINDDEIDYRQIIMHYDFTKNKTLPKITKYEKALLVGKRAKQIAEGASPNVKVLPGLNAIEIAEEELRQRKIPFIIKRPIGNKFEFWKPADMEVIMD